MIRKILLGCGIVSSVLYIAVNILGTLLTSATANDPAKLCSTS
jgi:hypothetical protein